MTAICVTAGALAGDLDIAGNLKRSNEFHRGVNELDWSTAKNINFSLVAYSLMDGAWFFILHHYADINGVDLGELPFLNKYSQQMTSEEAFYTHFVENLESIYPELGAIKESIEQRREEVFSKKSALIGITHAEDSFLKSVDLPTTPLNIDVLSLWALCRSEVSYEYYLGDIYLHWFCKLHDYDVTYPTPEKLSQIKHDTLKGIAEKYGSAKTCAFFDQFLDYK